MMIKRKITKENNFIYLTISIVMFIFSVALSATFNSTIYDYISLVTMTLIAITSFLSLNFNKHWKLFIIIIILLIVANQVISFFMLNNLYTSICSLLIMFFLLVGICFNIVNQVIFDCHCKNNYNRILGAISLYLMIGISWAIVYFLCVKISPDVIHGLTDANNYNLLFINTIYYSFVTITSLGYGDMYPISPILKVFSFIEAIIGLFYIAIIVATFVNGFTKSKAN